MLDSPYVRRVAVSLQYLGLRFQHEPFSVFNDTLGFKLLNPVLKAPTLICEDGTVLMDSTLILQYAEFVAPPSRSLVPRCEARLRAHLRLIGLALAGCEKSVQIVYERNLRPPQKIHEPWIERVTSQLLAAYREISFLLAAGELNLDEPMSQASITLAVACNFSFNMLPDIINEADFEALWLFSQQAEMLQNFKNAPFGGGRVDSN